MKAFINTEHNKQFFINRMQAHMSADELIQGDGYNDNGRGCSVGCTLNKYDHKAFETELGIPEWFARLVDHLHENTGNDYWPTFSIRWLQAVRTGMDVNSIRKPFLIFIQQQNIERVKLLDIDDKLKQQVVDAIELVIRSLKNGTGLNSAARLAARSAARSAAYSTRSAARSAAYSADSAYSAAHCAARSAADSAHCAARSAARSAYSADSADSAYSEARSAARLAAYLVTNNTLADELIRLLEVGS